MALRYIFPDIYDAVADKPKEAVWCEWEVSRRRRPHDLSDVSVAPVPICARGNAAAGMDRGDCPVSIARYFGIFKVGSVVDCCGRRGRCNEEG